MKYKTGDILENSRGKIKIINIISENSYSYTVEYLNNRFRTTYHKFQLDSLGYKLIKKTIKHKATNIFNEI